MSLSLVFHVVAGCSEEPAAQPGIAVTTTEQPAGGPNDAGSGNALRESDTPPPADAIPASDTAQAADVPAPPSFPQEKLEQMVAPIALYPDPLLMEILMAATYPAEVTAAAAWVKQHPGLNGKELDDAIADQRWDVSVNSLTHAPQALELLAADPQWMKDLGDAFLAQQDDVLNAVQVMRVKACDLGNLKTTAQQKVVIEPRPAAPAPAQQYVVPPPERVVRILPVEPEVVYVPTYNPRVIYGPPPPMIYYPGIYSYPLFSVHVAPVISFGVGLAIGGFLWGDLDWHHHYVYARPWYRDRYIGRYYWNGRYGGYNDFYRDGYARDGYWRHDWDHRRGVTYVNRNVENYYSVRGRDPYRYGGGDYKYDRYKASRYDREDFRSGRDTADYSRDRGGKDGGDWRNKAREDARQKMQRDSQPGGGGRGGKPDKAGMPGGGDRGGMDRSAKPGGGDHGGKGGGPDHGRAVEHGGKGGGPDHGGKLDKPSKGGGDHRGGPGGSSRGGPPKGAPSMKQGGGGHGGGGRPQGGGHGGGAQGGRSGGSSRGGGSSKGGRGGGGGEQGKSGGHGKH